MPRAIVTRPAKEAQEWVRNLRARGIDALALPLITIVAAADPAPLRQAWSQLGQFDAVMFVSGNAVRHFFAMRPAHSASYFHASHTRLRAWVTGPGSRAALEASGVAPGLIDAPALGDGQFDSEALWQQVRGSVVAGMRLLIVRGSAAGEDLSAQGAGRDWLAQQVVQAGGTVDLVVAYERRPPQWAAAQISTIADAAQDGSVWIFSSAEAVAYLRASLPQQSWVQARALATHARIAQAVRQIGFGQVLESRPVLEDVVASIESAA